MSYDDRRGGGRNDRRDNRRDDRRDEGPRQERPIFNLHDFRGVHTLEMNASMRQLLADLLYEVIRCAKEDNVHVETEIISLSHQLAKVRQGSYRVSRPDSGSNRRPVSNDEEFDDEEYDEVGDDVKEPEPASAEQH